MEVVTVKTAKTWKVESTAAKEIVSSHHRKMMVSGDGGNFDAPKSCFQTIF